MADACGNDAFAVAAVAAVAKDADPHTKCGDGLRKRAHLNADGERTNPSHRLLWAATDCRRPSL